MAWNAASTGLAGDALTVYDIAVEWQTMGYGKAAAVAWAATKGGLYRSAGLESWTQISLPDPGSGVPTPYSLCCPISTMDTVYVLGEVGESGAGAWLLLTEDAGSSWSYIELAALNTEEDEWGEQSTIGSAYYGVGKRFWEYGGKLYGVLADWYWHYFGGAYARYHIFVRDDAAKTWSLMDSQPNMASDRAGDSIRGAMGAFGDYDMWITGLGYGLGAHVPGPGDLILEGWNGFAWVKIMDSYTLPSSYLGKAICNDGTNAWFLCASVKRLDTAGNQISDWRGPETYSHDIVAHGGDILIAGVNYIRRIWGDLLTADEATGKFLKFVELGSDLYCIETSSRYLYVRNDGTKTWAPDGHLVPSGELIRSAFVHTGYIYVGTSIGNLYKRRATGYELVGTCDIPGDTLTPDITGLFCHSGVWVMSGTQWDGRPGYPDYSQIWGDAALHVPDYGYPHLLDIDVDGQYLYAALLGRLEHPVILKADAALTGVQAVYQPVAGTWAGVACDWYDANKLWVFGDLGAASKARRSDDAGVSTDDKTGSWSGSEVVSAIVPDLRTPGELAATLAVVQDALRSTDDADTWAKQGNTPFTARCLARELLKSAKLWAGSPVAGPRALSKSGDRGASWKEDSPTATAGINVVVPVVTGVG